VIDEKIFDKIKKCLALAASSNPHEAAAALRQAQALMAKHRVTMTDIEAAAVSEAYAKAGAKTKPAEWESGLADLCGIAFGCDVLFAKTLTSGGQWLFIGTDAAPEMSGYAFEVLLRQIKKDRSAYIKDKIKRCKPATKTQRADSYCDYWVFAARQHIDALARNPEQERAVQSYRNETIGNLSALSTRQRNSAKDRRHDDARAGFAAGKEARLHQGVKGKAQKRIGQ
jgi:hypothetical protein